MIRYTFQKLLSVKYTLKLIGRASENQLPKESSGMIDITLSITCQHAIDVIDLNVINFAGS